MSTKINVENNCLSGTTKAKVCCELERVAKNFLHEHGICLRNAEFNYKVDKDGILICSVDLKLS